jgi:hypothetical protein
MMDIEARTLIEAKTKIVLGIKRLGHTFFLLILLFGCSHHSHWTSDQMNSNKKEFCSTKLSYSSKDPLHGIDLEFLKTEDRLKLYLNVHSVPVSSYQDDPKSALLKLNIDGKMIRCQTYRFEGGQRFLLPDEIANIIIHSLQNNKEVTFILPGYRSTIKTEGFSSKFDQLIYPFPLQNPFHLPL